MRFSANRDAGPRFVLVLALAAASVCSVGAIVIRHDRPDAAALRLGKPFVAVGRVMPDGACTLIAPAWALTAAHVAASIAPGGLVAFDGRSYTVARTGAAPEGHCVTRRAARRRSRAARAFRTGARDHAYGAVSRPERIRRAAGHRRRRRLRHAAQAVDENRRQPPCGHQRRRRRWTSASVHEIRRAAWGHRPRGRRRAWRQWRAGASRRRGIVAGGRGQLGVDGRKAGPVWRHRRLHARRFVRRVDRRGR